MSTPDRDREARDAELPEELASPYSAPILEANLKALLTRAYKPALPSEAFRAHLTRLVAARAAELRVERSAPRSPRRFASPRRILLAAAVLLGVALGFHFTQRRQTERDPLRAILERGAVALRFERTAPWSERSAAEARDGLRFEGSFAELATPPEANALLLTERGRLELAVSTHASLEQLTEPLFTLELRRGRAVFRDALGTREFSVPGRYELASRELARGERVERAGGAAEDESTPPPPPAAAPTPSEHLLRARVLDAETREPLAACTVTLARLDEHGDVTPPERRFESLVEGVFELAAPASRRLSVRVRAEGYAAARRDLAWPRPTSGADEAAEELLEFALDRGSAARGRVIDADTGAPLAGALVFSETDAPQPQVSASARALPASLRAVRTDEDGRFELAHLSTGRQLLRALHEERAAGWSAPFDHAPWKPMPELVIALGGGGGIRGEVRRANGEPWAASFVVATRFDFERVHPCGLFATAVSDGRGRFELARLPAGHYLLLHFGGLPGERVRPLDFVQLRVETGHIARAVLGGPASEDALRGVLRDASGAGLANATLTFVEGDGDIEKGWPMAFCDAAGRFALREAPAGAFRAYATLDEGTTLIYCGTLRHDPHAPVEHELSLRALGFRGHVRFEDGRPIANALVVVEERQPDGSVSFAGKTSADESGAYELLGFPPGEYRAIAYAVRATHGQESSGWTQLLPGEMRELDFKLWPGSTLHIEVVDATGAPIDAAQVFLENAEGSTVAFAPFQQTDPSGVFVARGCSPGTWTARAAKTGYARSTPQRVDVRVGEPARVRLVLEAR